MFYQALIVTTASLLFASGCNGSIGGQADPREPYRKALDEYIRNYVQPETEIPVVYAEDQKDLPDYASYAALTKDYLASMPYFKNAVRVKSLKVSYTGDKGSAFKLEAERVLNAEDGKVMEKKIAFTLAKKDQNPIAAAASIPEVTLMPAGIPKEQEEAVAREMNMFFQLLLPDNVELLPRAVSLEMAPVVNVVDKKVKLEPQEYPAIADRSCCRLKFALKEMFGGGMLYIYAAADSAREIRRIVLPALTMDPDGAGLQVTIQGDYKDVNGFKVPTGFLYNNENFTLTTAAVEAMPAPVVERTLVEVKVPASETAKDQAGTEAKAKADDLVDEELEEIEKSEEADVKAAPAKKEAKASDDEEEADEEAAPAAKTEDKKADVKEEEAPAAKTEDKKADVKAAPAKKETKAEEEKEEEEE